TTALHTPSSIARRPSTQTHRPMPGDRCSTSWASARAEADANRQDQALGWRPMPSRPRVEWLVFAALGFAWGSSYLFIKIGVETLTPFTLVAARLAIGTAVLALVMRLTGHHLPRARSAYGHLLVVALLGVVIPFSLITWGEQ